jgi:hypothetical protein
MHERLQTFVALGTLRAECKNSSMLRLRYLRLIGAQSALNRASNAFVVKWMKLSLRRSFSNR